MDNVDCSKLTESEKAGYINCSSTTGFNSSYNKAVETNNQMIPVYEAPVKNATALVVSAMAAVVLTATTLI
jgi:hypothetical protein